MKKTISCIIAFLLSLAIYADDGDWRIYAAYHDAQRVAEMDGKIFVLSDGGLYSYDPEDNSIETYDKTNLLNDLGIYDILPCETTKELVIIYRNGNIDLMSDEKVYNMPDLKNKALSNKTINDAILEGSTLYLSTGSGIVCVDIENRAFGDHYNWGENVLTMVVMDGKIIASTDKGPYTGKLSVNLLNPSNWVYSGSTSRYTKYRLFNGTIYGIYAKGLAYMNNGEKITFKSILSDQTTNMTTCNGKFFVSTTSGKLYEVTSPTQYKTLEDGLGIQHLIHHESSYWGACKENGLAQLKISDDITAENKDILPNSPRYNYSYHLNLIDNKRLLMTGGTFNYTAGNNRIFTVMRYEDNEWTTFDADEALTLYGNIEFQNAADVIQDPDDPNHHYVGTIRSGIYEFQDFKYVGRYSYDNSPLQTILPDNPNRGAYVRVAGLTFDSQKNLWMCNTEVETIIRILKADKTWTSYQVPEIAGNPTFDQILFDRNGWAWINSRRGLSESMQAGVLIINTKGNPGNPDGFSHRFFSHFYNQDGTLYSTTLMNCLCFDLDGSLWLGYEKGLFVSYHPEDLFNSSDTHTTLTQVKVPRNDGTNLADYLLNDVPIKCIAIDGGNRKWIGTEGQGVYLVSADGLETIAHYTSENSPLVNNDVYDIKVNGATGEVFFATNGGLCSLLGDATDPVAKFDKDLVKVYPNPIGPEYDGKIVIRGLMYGSHVKIVNAAGKLVNEGTSVGGEYTWSGRLSNGKRAASGVYYILATDEAGKNGVVGKFLIIN